MRARRINHLLTATLGIIFLFLGSVVQDVRAQNLTELFDKVSQSVVKVRCDDIESSATGFIWNEPHTVVTALHVVDRSNNIIIYFPERRVSRHAEIIKVLTEADLVLLSVDNPPDLPALSSASSEPQLNEEVHTLGFPLNFTSISSFTYKLRYGGRRLKDNISDKVVKALEDNGYPSPDLEILKLGDESLLPGLSGAPIFNSRGQVVGIGDGGLEEGAINISWGIPSNQLARLLNSTTRHAPGARGTRELFAAELQLDVGETIRLDGAELVKVRTRSFLQLAATADDQLGLYQLSNAFAAFNPSSFIYNIYQDLNSGATVVIPQGAEITRQQNWWVVTMPRTAFDRLLGRRRYEMKLQIVRTVSHADAQLRSQQFEEAIVPTGFGYQWQLDQQWTYSTVLTRFDGLVVRRKGAYGYVNNGFTWVNDKYLFLTHALKGNVFMGYAVINYDNTQQTLYNESLCNQGGRLLQCPALFESRRLWAMMVLGVHMTSFSL